MQANDSAALEDAVTNDSTDLEQRDVRALTEYMTTLPLGGDVYSVTTESGSEYRVDILAKRCTCPDYKHNLPTDDGRELCKHLRRVAFATGKRSIPKWVDLEAIDAQLGQHTEATVTNPTSGPLSLKAPDSVTADENNLQPDGGTATVSDDPDTCPNGTVGCDGPDGETLPCFDCYEVDK